MGDALIQQQTHCRDSKCLASYQEGFFASCSAMRHPARPTDRCRKIPQRRARQRQRRLAMRPQLRLASRPVSAGLAAAAVEVVRPALWAS